MIFAGNRYLSFLLDAIFPRYCVACGQEDRLLCFSCAEQWQHQPPTLMSDRIAAFAYADPIVRKLIRAWKYDYDQSAFHDLTKAVNERVDIWRQIFLQHRIEAVVPLPLSSRRWRERGFNQSQQLADWLGRECQLPVVHLLDRAHRTGHQAERSDEDRQRAMQANPFYLRPTNQAPVSVLLVDDVWTTGSTLTAAKRVLEKSGETQVFCFTLAQG
jgi:ComF family protein